MNHAISVDASLAVKWVIDEDHTDRALGPWADSLATNQTVTSRPTSPARPRTRFTSDIERQTPPITWICLTRRTLLVGFFCSRSGS